MDLVSPDFAFNLLTCEQVTGALNQEQKHLQGLALELHRSPALRNSLASESISNSPNRIRCLRGMVMSAPHYTIPRLIHNSSLLMTESSGLERVSLTDGRFREDS
jgi:hypothetical protein